ncbi:MAG TPA: chorismate-binding protein [Candidatus Limiplasma sp.]|nr:chorismate-binding protein [Candidatus Limiplasma sp.]
MHIVSEVEGCLADKTDPFGLFCATFPAGTVSGAPRVRAMELRKRPASRASQFSRSVRIIVS